MNLTGPDRSRAPLRRDRSASASRSVVTRAEIGRTPARDRSSFHGSAALRWFRGAACGFRPRARRARLDVGLAGLSRTDLEPEPDRSQCGAWRVCLAGVGRLRCCTWEAGAPVGRGLFFVGMTGSSGDNCVWRSGSHVRSGGSTHMGTGPRPLLIVLFRMIPRFPPTPNARECATHPPPPVHEGHEDAGRAPLPWWWSQGGVLRLGQRWSA